MSDGYAGIEHEVQAEVDRLQRLVAENEGCGDEICRLNAQAMEHCLEQAEESLRGIRAFRAMSSFSDAHRERLVLESKAIAALLSLPKSPGDGRPPLDASAAHRRNDEDLAPLIAVLRGE